MPLIAWHPGQQQAPQSFVQREPVEGEGLDEAGGVEVGGGAVVT